MTCDVIRPLFRCNRLRELQVCYGGDFRVDSESVQSMGEAWSDLEILNLCAGAKSSHWDGAPLTLLQEFAAEFGHKLRRLALNFAYTQELPTADTVSTSFSQLEILGVGKTKIDSVDHFGVLAEFLVSVCSKEAEIAYISKDFWRADAFQTTGWENAPEAKNWVAVKQNMESDDARYTPDLLDVIFGFLDMESLKNAACVCRVWHDIAIDQIWQVLRGLLPLIHQFWPPWINAKNGIMDPDPTEYPELWSRFRAYSRRVRKLDGGIGTVSQAVQNFLKTLETAYSAEKDFEPPLPSLREIIWEPNSVSDTLALRFFVSPFLRRLSIRPTTSIRPMDSDLLSQLFSHLSNQNLHLAAFNLDTKWTDEEDEKLGDALASFIRSQPALEEVLFPKFYVQHSLISALTGVHRLRKFHGVLHFDTSQEVDSFIAGLAEACPTLRNLVLYVTNDRTENHSIRFDSISPLLSCKSLVEFQILHGRPLQLGAHQIHAIGQAWPSIATLSLCPNVIRSYESGLPLLDLVNFGPRSFPMLERLAVFLDLSLLPDTGGGMALSQLKTLCVGTASINPGMDAQRLAQYIATICSPSMRLCNAADNHYRKFVFDERGGPHDLVGRWLDVWREMERHRSALYGA
ncbi:hypothetical protein FRC01_011156 [Tulasnella sp. 417]|nr:hypothetical protein FRC01_011156 [Tulasnella sp. 417]